MLSRREHMHMHHLLVSSPTRSRAFPTMQLAGDTDTHYRPDKEVDKPIMRRTAKRFACSRRHQAAAPAVRLDHRPQVECASINGRLCHPPAAAATVAVPRMSSLVQPNRQQTNQ
ncbi:hypothetical protein BO85DRAFT_292675 [Aspergillus piperis CBS 112811]|uniref:Uncharacterized protein n=1 Tax=Aspergillus piperis CBS 112811 TaxID=1448313 RepID=A0A8G1VLP9_9EURO|nr:hypothetical protein BO85DRAFT_292675 [Aspergillus piperis CBS 112811]RAH58039.1 hypothetical protein BO85DRAFT_292675 [Aspergillus piperis CBS 112811]